MLLVQHEILIRTHFLHCWQHSILIHMPNRVWFSIRLKCCRHHCSQKAVRLISSLSGDKYLWDCVRKTQQYKSDASGGLACASYLEILNLGKFNRSISIMQQSPGTFSTIKCDIENTCVIHQKREIELVMERGINTKSQREWGKCLDKAVSLVPRFACAPQDNSYRPPCQKSPAPSANTFLFRGFQVRRGPRPILRRALVFLQNSTSLSTYFWSLWSGIYSRTLYKRTHMYELRTTWKK